MAPAFYFFFWTFVLTVGVFLIGTYLHGSFGNENIRHALVSHLHERKGIECAPQVADSELDVYGEFAGAVRKNVGVGRVCGIIGVDV